MFISPKPCHIPVPFLSLSTTNLQGTRGVDFFCAGMTDIPLLAWPLPETLTQVVQRSSMSVTLEQDPERWIPLPPDEWEIFLQCHSGNGLEGRRILIEALKNDQSHAPAVPLMDIQRGPSHAGRRGRIVAATCGSCPYSSTFQKVAEHIVSEHLRLSLWYCDSW